MLPLAQAFEPPPCEWCHERTDGTYADTLASPPCRWASLTTLSVVSVAFPSFSGGLPREAGGNALKENAFKGNAPKGNILKWNALPVVLQDWVPDGDAAWHEQGGRNHRRHKGLLLSS